MNKFILWLKKLFKKDDEKIYEALKKMYSVDNEEEC